MKSFKEEKIHLTLTLAQVNALREAAEQLKDKNVTGFRYITDLVSALRKLDEAVNL